VISVGYNGAATLFASSKASGAVVLKIEADEGRLVNVRNVSAIATGRGGCRRRGGPDSPQLMSEGSH
jgi:hypothetical protein